MRRKLFVAVAAASAILLANVAPAKALRIMPNSRPAVQQAMTAEVIVIGKVGEIEKDVTKATPNISAKDKIDYHVAVIKITESIQGAKGLTTIRVGWQGGAQPVGPSTLPVQPAQPAIQPIRRPQPQVALSVGQEGCFFLTKHHDGDFYVMQQFSGPLDKKAADYEKQLSNVKKLIKAFEDPKAALKATEASDRQLAACMLLQKYRIAPPVNTPNAKLTQEPIDAEVSKLILQTLSEMEWGKTDPTTNMGLQNVWYLVGAEPKDGWNQPKSIQGQDYNKILSAAVSKWLKENAEKYRIQRYVVAK